MTEIEVKNQQQMFFMNQFIESVKNMSDSNVAIQFIDSTRLPNMSIKKLADRWGMSRRTILRFIHDNKISLDVINEGIGRGEEKVFGGLSIQVAEQNHAVKTTVTMKA